MGRRGGSGQREREEERETEIRLVYLFPSPPPLSLSLAMRVCGLLGVNFSRHFVPAREHRGPHVAFGSLLLLVPSLVFQISLPPSRLVGGCALLDLLSEAATAPSPFVSCWWWWWWEGHFLPYLICTMHLVIVGSERRGRREKCLRGAILSSPSLPPPPTHTQQTANTFVLLLFFSPHQRERERERHHLHTHT